MEYPIATIRIDPREQPGLQIMSRMIEQKIEPNAGRAVDTRAKLSHEGLPHPKLEPYYAVRMGGFDQPSFFLGLWCRSDGGELADEPPTRFARLLVMPERSRTFSCLHHQHTGARRQNLAAGHTTVLHSRLC